MSDMNVFILMLLDYQVCLSAIVLPNRCSFHFQYELILLSKLLASSSNTWQGFEGVFFLQSFENLKEFEFGLGNLSHSLEQCLDAMTAISHVHIITSLAWQIREVPIFLALTSKGMEAAFYSRRRRTVNVVPNYFFDTIDIGKFCSCYICVIFPACQYVGIGKQGKEEKVGNKLSIRYSFVCKSWRRGKKRAVSRCRSSSIEQKAKSHAK